MYACRSKKNYLTTKSLSAVAYTACYRAFILVKMEEKFEKLGQLIDSIDNLAHALKMPLPPKMHVEQLSIALPEKVKQLKEVFVEIRGENPWD